MDPLFTEISEKFERLTSDNEVHTLIELVSSIRFPGLTDYLLKRVPLAAKLSRPETSLNVVKFIFLYGKKDTRFFSSVAPIIPSLVMFCHQTAEDPGSLKLYVESWRMNAHWRDIAEKCLSSMSVKEGLSSSDSGSIRNMSTLLKKSGELSFMLERISRHPSDPKLLQEMVSLAELRLHAVTETLNLVEKIS